MDRVPYVHPVNVDSACLLEVLVEGSPRFEGDGIDTLPGHDARASTWLVGLRVDIREVKVPLACLGLVDD